MVDAATFVAESRHVTGAGAITLEVIWPGADGEPADITANTATVSIVDADGTELQAGSATIDTTTTGRASFDLAATHTARPRWLVATWTRDDGAVRTSTHELVGGVYFTVAQARAERAGMHDTSKYTSPRIAEARGEVERECEEICGVAFVPRFARVIVDGSGRDWQRAPHRRVRSILSVTVDDEPWTAEQIAAVDIDDALLVRESGCWPLGRANIVVEYLHGMDRPPSDMLGAHLRRTKYAIDESPNSGVPIGAFTAITPEGQITLQRPEADRTGDHVVDAVYERHNDDLPGLG